MAFGEAVRIAVASLWAHKMRSVLTLIGVVIGVTSVIAVVSIVNGLNQYVAERIFNLGADVFLVNRGPAIITNIDQYEETEKRRKFTLDDYMAVRDSCQSCAGVGASLSHANANVKRGVNYFSNTDVRGWTPEMTRLYDTDLLSGRHITQLDVERGAAPQAHGHGLGNSLEYGLQQLRGQRFPDESAVARLGRGDSASIGGDQRIGPAQRTRKRRVAHGLTCRIDALTPEAHRLSTRRIKTVCACASGPSCPHDEPRITQLRSLVCAT